MPVSPLEGITVILVHPGFGSGKYLYISEQKHTNNVNELT